MLPHSEHFFANASVRKFENAMLALGRLHRLTRVKSGFLERDERNVTCVIHMNEKDRINRDSSSIDVLNVISRGIIGKSMGSLIHLYLAGRGTVGELDVEHHIELLNRSGFSRGGRGGLGLLSHGLLSMIGDQVGCISDMSVTCVKIHMPYWRERGAPGGSGVNRIRRLNRLNV